jgi:ATP-binding protein involved in chromosome partitioning
MRLFMPELNEVIDQLKSYHISSLNIDLKNLPLSFFANQENQLVIQADIPLLKIEELLKGAFPSILWQNKIQSHKTQIPGMGLKNIKNAIAIVSGKGGVGKSTISTNLACATALLGAQVGLLDADIYGPSIPTMMGIHDKPIVSEENLYNPLKNHLVECMSMGFLANDGPLIWRGPMLAKALFQMINQTAWSQLDYLFIDMPPGTGDIPLSLTQKIPLSGAVIVTTPQTIATLDAEKALEMFIKLNIPILGILENMAWYECEKCQHHTHIFGEKGAEDLAKKYNIPFLGSIPLQSSIREHGDGGVPIATLEQQPLSILWQQIALQFAIQLSHQPLNYASKMPPIRQE